MTVNEMSQTKSTVRVEVFFFVTTVHLNIISTQSEYFHWLQLECIQIRYILLHLLYFLTIMKN